MSATFEKHLYFPKPLPSPKLAPKHKAPSAISASAVRDHQKKKNDQLKLKLYRKESSNVNKKDWKKKTNQKNYKSKSKTILWRM